MQEKYLYMFRFLKMSSIHDWLDLKMRTLQRADFLVFSRGWRQGHPPVSLRCLLHWRQGPVSNSSAVFG